MRTNKSALLCHYDRALNCGSQGLFSAICERRRDTRISRREASPCVESISCRHFASQTVEDELELSVPEGLEQSFAAARIRLQPVTPSIRGRPSAEAAVAANTWAGSPWRPAG